MLNYGPVALIIFSTFLSVFIGVLMNRRDVTTLKEDMNRQFDTVNRQFDAVNRQFDTVARQFSEVNGRLTHLEQDLREFYGMEKKLEGRVDELSRR